MNPAPADAPVLRSAFQRLLVRRPLRVVWLPFVIALVSGGVAMMPSGWSLPWISDALACVFLACLLWFLTLAVIRFRQKRIAAGFVSLACLLVSIGSLIPWIALNFIWVMGQSEDGFANDLKLPVGVELAEPGAERWYDDLSGVAADAFQAAIRASLQSAPANEAPVSWSVPSLEKLRKEQPALLDRWLAAHPGWRVFEEHGGRFATRRWMSGNQWQMSLHGYYSSFGENDGPSFQTRTTIGFSGKAWAGGGQRLTSGSDAIQTSEGNSMRESHVIIPVADLLVEQFEQSSTDGRPVTRAAVQALEREFAALALKPEWSAARELLPAGAVIRGSPSIELNNSYQGGIYNATIRCNPGEPGRIFLRAFEITRNHELSASRLKTASSEWVGWSDDPEEQFMSETHFTIYEGDWGQYYGARFEVWFEPDSGGAPRNLLERNFKIEGWMR